MMGLLWLIQVPENHTTILGIPWMLQTSCFWLTLNTNTSQSSNDFVERYIHAHVRTCTQTHVYTHTRSFSNNSPGKHFYLSQ